jgi:diadenosine tetraphosphate (Ap4A) HIT family hydrolase
MFELHPRLKQDLLPIKKMEISTAYLLPDSDNPWVVLVPEVVDVKELHELTREQQALLMEEINHVSHVLKDLF